MVMNGIDKLFETVVNNGYCIGCGACTAVDGSPIVIQLDQWGQFQATIPGGRGTSDEATDPKVLAVCPFSDSAADEDTIARGSFPPPIHHDRAIGYHVATFAGSVAEGDFRSRGSSGGMGKWIGYELMRRSMVDAVIHVVRGDEGDPDPMLYRYGVARTPDEVSEGSKSVYYPVEMSKVLDFIKNNNLRFLVVGVPCFVKAVRLLAIHDPLYRERVRFCAGLICGHLKSIEYANMMAWQCNIDPGGLIAIDFRKKLPGTRANQKGVEVVGVTGGEVVRHEGIVQSFFGTNYGHGLFKYNACDYCDDVTAETADVVIGDAWLPGYVADGRGTNVVIVRNRELLGVIEEAASAGRLDLHPLCPDDVAKSQAGGLRHRREGLAYRLYLKDRARQWRPRKRVAAGNAHLSRRQRSMYRLRLKMAIMSHICYKAAVSRGSYEAFERPIRKLVRLHERYYKKNNNIIFVSARLVARGALRVGRSARAMIRLPLAGRLATPSRGACCPDRR